MKSFGSDNHSGIHSDILAAIGSANEAHALSYGDDTLTAQVIRKFKKMFGESADVYFALNGTGANVISLKTLTRSYHAIICASTAHINVDECGAPEKHTGCKLLTVESCDGKLTPELVKTHLHGFGFQHHAQPKVISMSQPTELGTLYTVSEIKALADLAHQYDMYLHVDGARFANAVVALGVTPSEMIVETGVDVLSFGGTKNGMMIGEAVVFLNEKLSEECKYERKQLMQLASKMRFIAAQFDAYLTDDLWLKLAARSNRMAAMLASEIVDIKDIELTQQVETNGIFVKIPHDAIEKLQQTHFFYVWNEANDEVRWMTSFDTTEEDITDFVQAIKKVLD